MYRSLQFHVPFTLTSWEPWCSRGSQVRNTPPVGSVITDMRPAFGTSFGGISTWAPSWIASAVIWSALATWM